MIGAIKDIGEYAIKKDGKSVDEPLDILIDNPQNRDTKNLLFIVLDSEDDGFVYSGVVIEEYSQDNVTRGCGYRAEDLFCKALALRGFRPIKTKVKKFRGKIWKETGHDLDFIFRRDGICYGCEIKNTLGYIDKEELDIKIRMCDFFNLKPLFIMRYAPKTYNKLIVDKIETGLFEAGSEVISIQYQQPPKNQASTE